MDQPAANSVAEDVVRVAAIADVHCAAGCRGRLQPWFAQMAASADIIALGGDLTNHGLPEEAHALVQELSAVGSAPVAAVLGNHDYEAGQVDEVRRIVSGAGIHLLDGEVIELRGIGLAGVKGFGGGFGKATLSAFGEPAIKRFVQEAVDEVSKLEAALARSKSEKKIAILHYAPIRETVEGEPQEIFPYLGSSRLEEPLNRYQVVACIHGHAHKGAAEGRTRTGISVYNVAIPVMRATFPNRPPFRVLDVHVRRPSQPALALEAPLETDVG